MRQLTLTTAALVMGAVPAFAADLPVAPEPIDYVQICDAYGTGYFFIPGTETCLRIRGRVRAEYRWNDFGDEPNNWDRRTENDTSTRARGYLRMDARTQTEYGLLRAYIDMFATVDTPGFTGNDDDVVDRPSNDNADGSFGSEGDTSLTLDYAFVQFGGLTVGKAKSFFDFWTGYAYGAITTVAYSDENPWVAGYTADFGNGFSASIAVEDRAFREQGLYVGSYLFPQPAGADIYSQGYGGHRWPSFVGNLRVDQGWGSAQLMGAVQEIRYLSSVADGEVGWAIGAGVEFDLSDFLSGSFFALQGAYADGALGYIHSDWGGTVFDATDVFPTGLGGESDRRRADTSEGWSIAGGIFTEWTPEWNSALQLSYAEADNANFYDFEQFDLNAKIGWTPVSGFEIGTELGYRNVSFDNAVSPRGSDLETPDDNDIITVLIRVQRDF
ncbi:MULTISPECIES: porin [Pseudovibrio]|uniref:porin n=1 Tax=Stappiaceae TaxID=2821832 RepID=UPI0023659BC8|nr:MULTISPECIES: porin [Pseudovibrio]MDD7911332.1 porin [Pseudovibrio exalbescens]MDX5592981.1 porin [Pseudovibrio sp. SPO723]